MKADTKGEGLLAEKTGLNVDVLMLRCLGEGEAGLGADRGAET